MARPSSDTPAHVGGVPVWEYLTWKGRRVYFSRPDVGTAECISLGCWHALSAEACAARREAVADAAHKSFGGDVARINFDHLADAVLAALGLGEAS